ncbi:MAG: hypothetical protein AAB403_18015, partial [Planctomycetota bacterium]
GGSSYSAIGSGYDNYIEDSGCSFIGNGASNHINAAYWALIGGGFNLTSRSFFSNSNENAFFALNCSK